MDRKVQLRIQRYGWDAAAGFYHQDWEQQLRAAQDTLLDMADLQPGQSVLETACGTGMVTIRAALATGRTGSVHATDISGQMVEEVRRNCKETGLENVSFLRSGAEALALPDDCFDVALCALGLMYMPRPRRAIAETARCVRPGGKVVATVWGERRLCGWADIFPIIDARVASDVCPMFFASGAPGALKLDFEATGLVDIRETRQTEQLNFASGADLTRAIMLGGPVAMAVKRFNETVYGEVCAEFLASVSAYQSPNGSFSIPGEFVTVCGTVPE
jgi:SAM-dependent methyltransferase